MVLVLIRGKLNAKEYPHVCACVLEVAGKSVFDFLQSLITEEELFANLSRVWSFLPTSLLTTSNSIRHGDVEPSVMTLGGLIKKVIKKLLGTFILIKLLLAIRYFDH